MSGGALTGPLAVAAVLLVLAGAPKVGAPADLRRALTAVGLRVPGAAVRVGGAAEVALGLAALVVTSRVLALAVALSYAAFTAFVLLALSRGWPLSSCGCFGREDTPPSGAHAVVTGALAVLGLLGAGTGAPALLPAAVDGGVAGLLLVALVALGVVLAWQALVALPRLGVRVAAVSVARERAAAGRAPAPAPQPFRLLPLADARTGARRG